MTLKKFAIGAATLMVVLIVAIYALFQFAQKDPFVAMYSQNCSVCHGENLEGTALGTPLVGKNLVHGESIAEITKSIAEGFPARGMPTWSQTLTPVQIQSLAIFVSERRAGRIFTDFKVDTKLEISNATVKSEEHDFRMEVLVRDLHPLPYSIAPLPDGRILLSEKTRGLSILSPQGEQSELIRGTPKAYDDALELLSLEFGNGWLMDVALHPNYAENGWVYLHFGDRREGRLLPISMNKLVRARIVDGAWVDEETIWETDSEHYTPSPDIAAGGRITFDDRGHVFFGIGMKGMSNFEGIQDLTSPYGKIHRVHDDGRIPEDNPFVGTNGALPSIWTYGHRSPQGLEFNFRTGELWGTEMGPRGGDEVNLLLPGRNYGWPLTSKGVDYDGTPVEYGKDLGIEFDLEDIEQPIVDLTPSPAVSSFIFYEGSEFPEWKGNAIVGSLKATELYRFVIDDNRETHRETLIRDLARIRDIESGPDGSIYLLLEHGSGGQIVKLRRD